MSVFKLLARLHSGVSSRLRNACYRFLGADLQGYAVLRKISIPRQWSDVQIGADAALDDGVTLICSADPKPLKITIGARTYINRYTILDASDSLAIGEDCMIGPGCYLTDHDHGVEPGEAPGSQLLISSPTRIGNRVWLGAHVVILKGVTIGDDAVVAAGAVVTKDVAAGERVAGVPARPLRSQSQA